MASNVRSRLTVHRVAVIITLMVVITIFSGVATLLVLLHPFSGDDSLPPDIFINESWFYTRLAWHASPPRTETPLELPVDYVIIEHSAGSTCASPEECEIIVEAIQAYHMMSCQWADIGFNYLVGGGEDGGVYVGRGANLKGSHAYKVNGVSLGIGFVGDFNVNKPTANQLKHAQMLIQEAVKRKKVREDYKLRGHCQVSGYGKSPGAYLMEEIKKWPHWGED